MTRRLALDLILDTFRRRLGLLPAPDGAAPSEAVWHEVVRLAGARRVAPALGAALADLGVPDPKPAATLLAPLPGRNRERNLALRAALLETIGELNRIGIEPVLLKGAIRLVDELYPELDGFRVINLSSSFGQLDRS